MSLETWKAEFYPTPASECPVGQAVEHSLRKWRGLTAENLSKHGCRQGLDCHSSVCITDGTDCFFLGAKSCALCLMYDTLVNCDDCPLAKVLGNPCDEDGGSPWVRWTLASDPHPMIHALEAALAAQEGEA